MKNRLIKNIVDIGFDAEEGHIPSALSILDILEVVYGKILNLDLIKKQSINRDYFILSKGHGCLALYTILEKFKLMNKKELENFCSFNGKLGGHPDSTKNKFIECSTGSLGHGLPIGIGIALAGKIRKLQYKTIILLSDGENNEGSVWEGAMFAAANKLSNLSVIIDYNKWQATGRSNEVLQLDPLADKWTAFGWNTVEVEGHDISILQKTLEDTISLEKPTCIIAHTIKGKGVSFMEDDNNWHYRVPSENEVALSLEELKIL